MVFSELHNLATNYVYLSTMCQRVAENPSRRYCAQLHVHGDLAVTVTHSTLLPAANTHVRRITASYFSADCNVRYSSVTIAFMRL